MKMFKIKVGDRKFIVKAEDSVTAVKKLMGKTLEDDRLAPMTYKKLKELGYTNNQWKNWTQEQANKIIASHKEKATQETQKKEEKSSESKNSGGLGSVNKSQSENTSEEKSKFDIELDNSKPPENIDPNSDEAVEFYNKRRNKNADLLMKNKEVNSLVNSYIDDVKNNKWGSTWANKAPEVGLAEKRASLRTIEKTYEELGGDRVLNLIQSAQDGFGSVHGTVSNNTNAEKVNKYTHTLKSLKRTIDTMKNLGLSRYKTSLYTL